MVGMLALLLLVGYANLGGGAIPLSADHILIMDKPAPCGFFTAIEIVIVIKLFFLVLLLKEKGPEGPFFICCSIVQGYKHLHPYHSD